MEVFAKYFSNMLTLFNLPFLQATCNGVVPLLLTVPVVAGWCLVYMTTFLSTSSFSLLFVVVVGGGASQCKALIIFDKLSSTVYDKCDAFCKKKLVCLLTISIDGTSSKIKSASFFNLTPVSACHSLGSS